MRILGVGLFAAALLGGGIVACQDAVNLNVKYNDNVGVAAADAGLGSADGAASAPSSAPSPGNDELEACPCDQTQGLSCCVSAAGPAFCTTDRTRCDGENGAFYGCFGPDPLSESLCCWHGTGAHAQTAYAGDCHGGLQACTRSSECPGGQECLLTACAHVEIGGCGQIPTCPPGTQP